MRKLFLSCVVATSLPGMLWAQSGPSPNNSQHGVIQLVSSAMPCNQPCPHCGDIGCSRSLPGGPTCAASPDCGARPGCNCRICCQKPPCRPCALPPQEAPPQPMMQAAPQPGMFVQPPASGTVFGAQNRTEVEGFGLTFPEVNLRMPTLRFPSVQRSRRNARMELDQATAPYVEQAAPSYAPPSAAPSMVSAAPAMMAVPSAAPTMVMAAPSAAPTMMMAPPSYAPAMTMMQFTPQYVPVAPQSPPQAPPVYQSPPTQQAPPDNRPPAYGPPNLPDCEAPRPSCSPYGYSGAATAEPLATLNARMQQLEETERRIDQKLTQLQSSLAQWKQTHSGPFDPPNGLTADLRRAEARPITQPASHSGTVPNTASNHPAYTAQPAAYHSEPPVHLNAGTGNPQPIKQPATVIRQPSQGRMVGHSARP